MRGALEHCQHLPFLVRLQVEAESTMLIRDCAIMRMLSDTQSSGSFYEYEVKSICILSWEIPADS